MKNVRPLTGFLLTLIAMLGLCWVTWALEAEYRQALPGYTYRFPGDHAAHLDYKTEWWYYTGHLQTEAGKRYGYELTFFRVGINPDEKPKKESAWVADNVYPAHFAITDEDGERFYFTEKLNRPGIGTAGALPDHYYVWNELWLAELLGDRHVLHADSDRFKIRLSLNSLKPPAIHGVNGVSQKAACQGCASHYYSLTRLQTEGLLFIDGKPERVRGLSWMDHEFGSNQLAGDQVGWDWFSIQLENNVEVMLYVMRLKDGQWDPNSSGTLVYPNGQTRHLARGDFQIEPLGSWSSPRTAGRYPMGWRIAIPTEDLRFTVQPVMPDQELVTESTGVAYWEGSSHVQGHMVDRPVSGVAYVELTGYAEPFRQRI